MCIDAIYKHGTSQAFKSYTLRKGNVQFSTRASLIIIGVMIIGLCLFGEKQKRVFRQMLCTSRLPSRLRRQTSVLVDENITRRPTSAQRRWPDILLVQEASKNVVGALVLVVRPRWCWCCNGTARQDDIGTGRRYCVKRSVNKI